LSVYISVPANEQPVAILLLPVSYRDDGFVQHFKMLCLKGIQNLYQKFCSIYNRKVLEKCEFRIVSKKDLLGKPKKNQFILCVYIFSTPWSEKNLTSPKKNFPCLCQFFHFQAQINRENSRKVHVRFLPKMAACRDRWSH